MSSKCVVALLMFVLSQAFATSDDITEWNAFKTKYSKHYDSHADEISHFKIFVDHKRIIDEHNLKYEKGVVLFRMGLNMHSDLDKNERMIGHKINHYEYFAAPRDFVLPKALDWREHGVVTHVKNQQFCGSSYAMATTGAIESHYFRKTGQLLPLSDQNIVDCSQSYGNNGCIGGTMENAYKYIRDHGVYTAEAYPYDGSGNYYCQIDIKDAKHSNATRIRISEFVRIPSGNEEELLKALTIHGPISVSIDARSKSFALYSHGIYNDPNCDAKHVNHAVLLVGYGTDENGTDYYILKNNWGERWGTKGYFKMLRNQTNTCGIATQAMFPII